MATVKSIRSFWNEKAKENEGDPPKESGAVSEEDVEKALRTRDVAAALRASQPQGEIVMLASPNAAASHRWRSWKTTRSWCGPTSSTPN